MERYGPSWRHVLPMLRSRFYTIFHYRIAESLGMITKDCTGKTEARWPWTVKAEYTIYAAKQNLSFSLGKTDNSQRWKILSKKNYLIWRLLELGSVTRTNPVLYGNPLQKAVIFCQSWSERPTDFSIFSPAEAAAHESQGASVTSDLRCAGTAALLATLEF